MKALNFVEKFNLFEKLQFYEKLWTLSKALIFLEALNMQKLRSFWTTWSFKKSCKIYQSYYFSVIFLKKLNFFFFFFRIFKCKKFHFETTCKQFIKKNPTKNTSQWSLQYFKTCLSYFPLTDIRIKWKEKRTKQQKSENELWNVILTCD